MNAPFLHLGGGHHQRLADTRLRRHALSCSVVCSAALPRNLPSRYANRPAGTGQWFLRLSGKIEQVREATPELLWRQTVSIFRERGKERTGREGLWIECSFCGEISYRREVERLLWVCPQCNYHHPISVEQRIKWTVDEASFQEILTAISPLDPLDFRDERRYVDRVKEARQRVPHAEAVVCGRARLLGREIILGIQDFQFMGGSMGSVVGEKIVRTAELALETRTPLVLFTASGGARMQEGLISLMQMAKTTVAVGRLKETGVPYISVLTDPTTGGVAASFAMQGDVVLAEPRARIGFAGPRVIEKTLGEKLPKEFQRSEYLLDHGLIDDIVMRKQIRKTLSTLIGLLVDPMPEDPRD